MSPPWSFEVTRPPRTGGSSDTNATASGRVGLVFGADAGAAVGGVLGGGAGQPQQAQLADLHAGPQGDRQVGDVGELERDVPGKKAGGVDETGGGVGEQAEAAERRLAFQTPGEVVGQGAALQRRAEDEFTRVQDERFAMLGGFNQAGELVLLFGGGVDVGVAGVVEDPEQAVQPDVDARRLYQASSNGSMPSRPSSMAARISRSESSTRRAYSRAPAVVRLLSFVSTIADVVQWQNISFPS